MKKEKSFLALSLVSVIALAGVITVASVINRQSKKPYVDLNETETTTLPDDSGKVVQGETETKETQTEVTGGEKERTSDYTEVIENTTTSKEEVPVDVNPVKLMFSEEDTLLWPVEGRIVLEFSMDGSIYFPTLDQYKYNPAMLIQSDVDTDVIAACDCIVKEIGTNEEIGTYVVMSLGSDYQLTYGQLKALQVSEGDTLKAGDIIGTVSEPTKYYVVEGCNLYVKLEKGDVPIDPLDYIR